MEYKSLTDQQIETSLASDNSLVCYNDELSGYGTSTDRLILEGLETANRESDTIVRFPGADQKDWRVTVTLPQRSPIKSAKLLAPLKEFGGVVFPYIPTITMSHKATYSTQKLVHSNYHTASYESSEISEIGITGDFSVQTTSEGKYLLAAIHFFRTMTKMFYGGEDKFAGNPPPLVYLNGFGKDYFPNVMSAVTSFSHTMPPDVDYVMIDGSEGPVRVPTLSSIAITLQPMYSRKHIYDNFSLEKFANGDLLNKGFI